MACVVCESPKRNKIDEALLSGDSRRSVATRYGLGRNVLARHVDHLVPVVALAVDTVADTREASRGDALLATALEWEARLVRLYQRAEEAGSYGPAASIARSALAAMAFRLQVTATLPEPRDVTGTGTAIDTDAERKASREEYRRVLGIA